MDIRVFELAALALALIVLGGALGFCIVHSRMTARRLRR
jgi:hypothetical protein